MVVLWRACPRLQSVVRWSKDDAPLGICKLELSRCCSFSCLSHRVPRPTPPACRYYELNVLLENTVYPTLPLARAKEDSAATLRVTSAIPAQSGGQRVSPRSSQYLLLVGQLEKCFIRTICVACSISVFEELRIGSATHTMFPPGAMSAQLPQ